MRRMVVVATQEDEQEGVKKRSRIRMGRNRKIMTRRRMVRRKRKQRKLLV